MKHLCVGMNTSMQMNRPMDAGTACGKNSAGESAVFFFGPKLPFSSYFFSSHSRHCSDEKLPFHRIPEAEICDLLWPHRQISGKRGAAVESIPYQRQRGLRGFAQHSCDGPAAPQGRTPEKLRSKDWYSGISEL